MHTSHPHVSCGHSLTVDQYSTGVAVVVVAADAAASFSPSVVVVRVASIVLLH